MTLCESTILELNKRLPQWFLCRPDEAGHEVLQTPFLYPDKDHIEIFMRQLRNGQMLFSDMGQTSAKLLDSGFNPRSSARRRAMIFEVVSSFNVKYEDGAVFVVTQEVDIADKLWELLLAIQKLSDLVFTVLGYSRATFEDDFENYIVERQIAYQRGVQIPLPTGRNIPVDFIIKNNAIELLSGTSLGHARTRLDRVYKWFAEMKFHDLAQQKIAVVDNITIQWPDVDLDELRHQADTVLLWSQKRAIEGALVG